MGRLLIALQILFIANAVHASSFKLLLESDENQSGGAEVFLTSFNSFTDLVGANISSSTFSQLNIGANFSVRGLTYDGSDYHLLLESDENQSGGAEVFLTSFNSFSDLVAANISSSTFSQLDIGANFSVRGLTYDGSDYHLLLESNEDRSSGSEVFLTSFNSFTDLLAGNISNSTFSQLNIGTDFSVEGMAYDGSDYHLLLESNEDRSSGSEVFLTSFNSFTDLVGANISSSTFSQLNIGANFSSGGLVAINQSIMFPVKNKNGGVSIIHLP